MRTSHLTASVSSFSRNSEIHWQPRYHVSSTCGTRTQISEESWQSRAKLQGSVTGHRLHRSNTSGRSEKILYPSSEHIDVCCVGDGGKLVHNFELDNDCGFLNYQTQYRANLQPAKMTRIFSIITRSGVRVHEFHHRSRLSVVATLVLRA